ncbi:MAG: J domain-containing protein [Thermoflexaceae bacterium]|nr:J domain-containing protein [Thermoflexaceae bacterium]
MLGGEVEVQTVDRKLLLRIPELTQNGRQIRLGGKGMPILGGHGHGDLYARVRVALPEQLSDEERRLYEQLRELARARAGAAV